MEDHNPTLSIVPMGKTEAWRLELGEQNLSLSAPGVEEPIVVDRSEFSEKVELREHGLGAPLLLVRIPKATVFQPDLEQMDTLRAWLGPPTFDDLTGALRRRFKWTIPIALMFIVTAMPMAADPERNLAAVPFDALSAFLGVALLALAAYSKACPHPRLFLFDCFWFLVMAADSAMRVIKGMTGAWQWAFVVILIVVARSSFREYSRFSGVVGPPPSSGPE